MKDMECEGKRFLIRKKILKDPYGQTEGALFMQLLDTEAQEHPLIRPNKC